MSDYRDSVTLEQYEECLGDKSFFFAHNPEGIFTYVSPSITKVLGYAPEDFLAHYTQFLTDNPKTIWCNPISISLWRAVKCRPILWKLPL